MAASAHSTSLVPAVVSTQRRLEIDDQVARDATLVQARAALFGLHGGDNQIADLGRATIRPLEHFDEFQHLPRAHETGVRVPRLKNRKGQGAGQRTL